VAEECVQVRESGRPVSHPASAYCISTVFEGLGQKVSPLQASYDVRNFQLENHSIPGYLPAGFYRLHDTNYYGKPKGRQRRPVATFILDIKFY